MQDNSAYVHYSGVSSLRRRAFTTLMHYAENECVMPIGLHCNELRAPRLTTNVLCRTAEIGALLLKCVLIVYIWPEKGVVTSSLNCFFRKSGGYDVPENLTCTGHAGHSQELLHGTLITRIPTLYNGN